MNCRVGENTNKPDPLAIASMIHQIEAGVGALNEELIELQKRAALGAVAGLLAHEVNNILTPVLTYVRLAQREGASPEAIRRGLSEAEAGVRRTTEIAAAILNLGRGGTSDIVTHCNVQDIVRQAASALGRDLSRDGIACEIRVSGELEAAIAPTSLQQVLVNLLQNARSALLSQGGGGRICVEGSTWNTDTVRIEVADTGPGIEASQRGRIFEPFVRGELGMPGTGLGLTVCRELLSAVQGTIHVEPNQGGGARFVIDVPAAKPGATEMNVAAERAA